MQYDYYKILEIPRTSDTEEIKRAYRNKAKLVHPDVNNSPKANEVFALVNEAYEVLMDEQKRYLFDIKLNYIDSSKEAAERKKHYYGSSIKNDTYTNNTNNFNYDWNTYKNKQNEDKPDSYYFEKSPLIYNLFFACGMFVGFLIVMVSIIGSLRQYWPFPFILVSVPGFVLIREGWKGMIGKKTMIANLLKKIKK